MPAAAIILQLAPYVLEGLALATQWISVLNKGEAVTPEEIEALKARFEASQQNREAALDRLKAAVDAARAAGQS